MRTATAVIALALLLTISAHAQDRPIIIVDNDDAGFSKTDGWNASTRDEDFYGAGYLWHPMGDGSGKATWKAAIAKPGRYNVYVRWVASKPDDRADNAPYTVRAFDGDTTIRVNLKQMQSAAHNSPWNLLGTFPLRDEAQVTLTNDSNHSVVADAVKFEYMEPLGAAPPKRGKLLFQDDCDQIASWFIEGSEGSGRIADGTLRVTSTSSQKGVHAWLRRDIPDNVRIEYDMTVHGPRGFALVFFCAKGMKGEDIITGGLPKRDGIFAEYVNSDVLRCYHLSVHRMGTTAWVDGANLNKNPGKTLVQRNAVDPCPPAEGNQTYHMTLIKTGRRIQLLVDEKPVLLYIDDSEDVYDGGKFGFRQIYLSEISYDNVKVYEANVPEAIGEVRWRQPVGVHVQGPGSGRGRHYSLNEYAAYVRELETASSLTERALSRARARLTRTREASIRSLDDLVAARAEGRLDFRLRDGELIVIPIGRGGAWYHEGDRPW